MISLIYGEDEVRVDEATAAVIRSAGPDELRDVNSTTLAADDLGPNAVMSAAFTVPFLAERRVVVVKGLLSKFDRGARGRSAARGRGSGQSDIAPWSSMVEQLPSMPPTTHLAFVDGGVGRNNPLLRKLAPMSEVHEFPLPRDRGMAGWIAQRATELNVDIEPAACAVLADAVGRQPRLIDSELRKLSLYASGRRAVVDDVREMVAYVREANIFQAVDAVIDGRTGVALRLVRRIMDDGNPAAYLMTMIARQVRLLLMAKDMEVRRLPRDEIGRRLRLSGWVLNKTLQQASRLSLSHLAEVHARLIETDLTLKTKPIEEQLAIELLIAELTMGVTQAR